MSSPVNINSLFFDSSYQHVWKGIIPPGLSEVEVDFLVDVCGLQTGSRVLDLMCGYGRHALELARKGMQVTAVDNLAAYTEEITATAAEEGLVMKVLTEDVSQYQPEGSFDAVICMGNSFSFFNRTDAQQLIQRAAGQLQPGGSLVINSWMITEIALKHFQSKEWFDIKGYKYLLDYQYAFHPSRIESEQTIISPDGSTEMLKGIDYLYSLDDLEQMFQAAGLSTSAVYSTPRRKPFVLGDGRAYILAKKH